LIKLSRFNENQRGVTLIELLAVIVILGIIAAVAVPSVLGQINSSKTSVDAANQALIKDAVERAYLMEAVKDTDFPMTLTPGTSGGTITGGATPVDIKDKLIPNYLKEVPPLKDSTHIKYTVTIDSNKKISVGY